MKITGPNRNRVWLCGHCGHINDEPNLVLCPCHANTVTEGEVQRRHQVAVLRATRTDASSWGRAA